MLNRLPKLCMPLSVLLDDIGSPKARELARVFRVPEKTAAKWLRDDDAPAAVMLALFWLTRWGHSAVHCEAHNAAILHAGIAAGLRCEVDSLTAKLANLGRIADFGSANDPAPGVALPRPPPLLAAEKPAQPAETTGTSDQLPSGSTRRNQTNRKERQAVDPVNYRLGTPTGSGRQAEPINLRATGQSESGAK